MSIPKGAARCRGVDAAPTGLTVEVADPSGLVDEDERAWIEKRLAEACRELRVAGEVRVRLVGDAEMSAAHERYAGAPGTTDVLTFDLREDPSGPLDVDIWACVDEARRQGVQRGHGAGHELVLYGVHGVLHCMGHDDHDEEAFARMHALEDRVLEAIGLGRVFAAGGHDRAGRAG